MSAEIVYSELNDGDARPPYSQWKYPFQESALNLLTRVFFPRSCPVFTDSRKNQILRVPWRPSG